MNANMDMIADVQSFVNNFDKPEWNYDDYINFLAEHQRIMDKYIHINPLPLNGVKLIRVLELNYVAPLDAVNDSCNLTKIAIAILHYLPNLTKINIRNCLIRNDIPIDNFQVTDLRFNNVTGLDDFIFNATNGLVRFKNLKTLYIEYSDLNCINTTNDDDTTNNTLDIIGDFLQLHRFVITHMHDVTIPYTFNRLKQLGDLFVKSRNINIECDFSLMLNLQILMLDKINIDDFPDNLIYKILRRNLRHFYFTTKHTYRQLNENGTVQTMEETNIMSSENDLGKILVNLNAYNGYFYENIDTLQNVSDIDESTEGFDIFETGTPTIIDYLSTDPDHIAIKYHNSWYLLDKNNIKKTLVNSLRFSCGGDMSDNGNYPIINYNEPLIACKNWGLPINFISYKQFNTFLTTRTRYFEIKETNTQIASCVGLEYLFRKNAASASHCQDGQGGRMYKLYNIKFKSQALNANSSMSMKESVGGNKKFKKCKKMNLTYRNKKGGKRHKFKRLCRTTKRRR